MERGAAGKRPAGVERPVGRASVVQPLSTLREPISAALEARRRHDGGSTRGRHTHRVLGRVVGHTTCGLCFSWMLVYSVRLERSPVLSGALTLVHALQGHNAAELWVVLPNAMCLEVTLRLSAKGREQVLNTILQKTAVTPTRHCVHGVRQRYMVPM